MLSKEPGVAPHSDYYVYTKSATAEKMFLYPTCVGLFSYYPGYHLYREAFDSYVIMFIRSGECRIEVGGRKYIAKTGQVVMLNCYEPHAYGSDVGWVCNWLHFDGICAHDYFLSITDNASPVIILRDTYRLEKYLYKIYTQFKDAMTLKEPLLNNYIVNVLTELLVNQDHIHEANTSSGIIEDTVTYINEHLNEELSLELLSYQASLSPFYFSRLFKKETGFSPHHYILTARVNNAKFLLKSTGSTIKDICFASGFTSESNFCAAFKKIVGHTPSEYRSTLQLSP